MDDFSLDAVDVSLLSERQLISLISACEAQLCELDGDLYESFCDEVLNEEVYE